MGENNFETLFRTLENMIRNDTSETQFTSKEDLLNTLNHLKDDPDIIGKYGVNKTDFEVCIKHLLNVYDEVHNQKNNGKTNETDKPIEIEKPKVLTLNRKTKNTRSAFIDLLILSILSFGFSLGVLVYILFKTSI